MIVHLIYIFYSLSSSTTLLAFVQRPTFTYETARTRCKFSNKVFVPRFDLHQTSKDMFTLEDVQNYASQVYKTNLTLSTLGPGYRVVARSLDNPSVIYGYCSGFVRPAGDILHIDALQVFNNTQTFQGKQGLSSAGKFGWMIGCAAVRHGFDKGCSKCEVLAIDDAPSQHRRLVRHFERMGLKKVRYVGDDFSSIPDRLVWGGCGTLMEATLVDLLEKWASLYKSTLTEP